MRTLRERLTEKGRKVIDLDDCPSYIHNYDFDDSEDSIELSWTDEHGYIYNESYDLDGINPEVKVFQLTEIV